jgi:Tol biopolymer transport system component
MELNDLPFVEAPPLVPSSALVQEAAVGKPATSHATGLEGKLVFTTGSGGELYVIDVDGSDLRRLAGGVIDPVLLPNGGQQVAFVRWDGAKFGALYTINLDGSGERAIVGDIRQPKSPAWSPDGREIIFSFQHGGLRDPEEICKEYDFDDGIRLPDNIAEITKSRISHDGIVICYILKEDLRWGLRRVEVASGQFEDLPADDYSYTPAWDPQQPWRVIYDGDKGLIQFDVTHNTRWPVTTDLRDTGPVFSPDGRYLALTYKQHDHWEVYTIDLETGARHRLTKPPILADPQYNSAAPAWSPDGSHLAFVTDRTGQWEIWVMNADGSNQRPLFSPEVQAELNLEYRGMNERMLNWAE